MYEPSLGSAFEEHRRLLWGICYRMSGTGADADDLLQETFERALKRPPAADDRDLKPWLVQIAMNACRDHLLTPSQRAVLVLRDVLDCSVQETADMLEMSVANVKTTLHRARQAMQHYDGSRRASSPEQRQLAQRALRAFLLHIATHNIDALRALMREDAVMLNDGGGEYFAARKPVIGVDKIFTFHRKTRRTSRFRMAFREVNGTLALLVDAPSDKARLAPRMVGWVELDEEGRIAELHWVLTRRKLEGLDFESLPTLSMREWLHALRDGWTAQPFQAWLPTAMRRLYRHVIRA